MKNRQRQSKGEDRHSAKLTEDDVVEIRKLSNGGVHFKELSKEFGVSDTQIRRIVKKERWKHVRE
jgi:DNA invertase Pin-like site-specific DNA recombinase